MPQDPDNMLRGIEVCSMFRHMSMLISSSSKGAGSLTVAMVAGATELALVHGRWQEPRHHAIHAPNQRSNACRTAHSRIKPSAAIG